MSTILERSFKVLEHLATCPEGVPLSTLASELDMPLSATHRLLAELVRCGYVRQHQNHSDYMLTIKLVSLGLSFLSASGIVDIAQPPLDRLAAESSARPSAALASLPGFGNRPTSQSTAARPTPSFGWPITAWLVSWVVWTMTCSSSSTSHCSCQTQREPGSSTSLPCRSTTGMTW